MIKIKKLPLESWMQNDILGDISKEGYEETPRVFDVDGYYLVGDKCWFETEGTAYLYSKGSFLHHLKLLNYKPLRDVEYMHLKGLIKVGYKSKELREAYNNEYYYRSLRHLEIKTMLSFMKVFND